MRFLRKIQLVISFTQNKYLRTVKQASKKKLELNQNLLV